MKKSLTHAVLASSLFLLPTFSQAALVPVLIDSNSATFPDAGQGYLFSNIIPANITLTISDGYVIGKSAIAGLPQVEGSVDALTAGIGANDTLAFAGAATATATIGASNPIGVMTLNAAKTVNFQGNVTVLDTKLTADATAALSDAVIFTGNIDNTTGVVDTGTLQFQGGGQITGTVGATDSLKLLTVNAASSANKVVELNGAVINVATLNIGDDASGIAANGSTLTLNNAAMQLTGDITANTHNENTLNIVNAAMIVGEIGKNGTSLNLINVALNGNTTISGNIFATTTQLKGNNVLIMDNGNTITGTVDTTGAGVGALEFQGEGKITGNIGNTHALSKLLLNTAGGLHQIEFNGAVVKADSINLVGGGNATTLLLNSVNPMAVTASILSNNNNLDILNVASAGPTTITGNIGGAGAAFNLVKVAQNNNITLNGNLTAITTQFQGNHTMSIADTNIITGTIDTTVAQTGTLQFLGGGRVTGNIGAINALNALELNTGAGLNKILELNGATIKATNINLIGTPGSATTLLLNTAGPMTLTGDINSNNNQLDILNVANTGATTLTGNIGTIANTLNTIYVAQNANTTLHGNLFAVNTQFKGNNTLIVEDGFNINSAIDTLADATGTLQLQGTTTVTGDIGNTHALAAINLQGLNKVVTFQGDVTAKAINFTNDGTARIVDGKRFNGPIDADVGGQGTLIFEGSSVINHAIGDAALKMITFNGGPGTTVHLHNDLYATDVLINNGGNLSISAPYTIYGNFSVTNESILSLTTNADPLTVTDDFTLATGTTYQLDMQNLIDAGRVNVLGTATVDPNAKITILNAPANIPGGSATITIVTDGAGGGGALNIIPVTSNSLLTHFSTKIDGNLLQLVVGLNPVINILNNCANEPIAYVIDNLITSSGISGSLLSILNQLNTFSDPNRLCHSLNELAPIVDGAILYESFEGLRHALDVIQETAAKRHFCRKNPGHTVCRTGQSSGDLLGMDQSIWIKAFGLHTRQEKRENVNGYKDNMTALALGTDLFYTDYAQVGFALNWAHLDIHHSNTPAKTKSNSFQEILYGSYDFENPIFINWSIALAYNTYNINRHIQFGNIFLAPSAHLHGWQTAFKTEIGYDIEQYSIHTVPKAYLYYSHLALSEYTERNVNTANQQVNAEHFNSLLGGVGIQFVYDYLCEDRLYQPEIHFMTFYDFIGDPMAVTSQFVGGGPSFKTVGFSPARASFNIGTSLNTFLENAWYISAQLDWNVKNDYQNFTGFIKCGYKW